MANATKPFEVTWTRPCGLTIRQRRATLAEARDLAAIKAATLPVGSMIRICEIKRDTDGTAMSVHHFEQFIGRKIGMANARKNARSAKV